MQAKRLKPSHKPKKHYLVIAANEAERGRTAEICKPFKARFILYDEKKGKMIVSALTKEVNALKSALAGAGIKCVGVSGTIKRAKQKFLQNMIFKSKGLKMPKNY